MKKLLNKLLALSLCACMMLGAASTASAAELITYDPFTFNEWLNQANSYTGEFDLDISFTAGVLNVSTDNNVKNMDKVNLYPMMFSGANGTQTFKAANLNQKGYRIYCENGFNEYYNTGFTLNRNYTNNTCVIYEDLVSERAYSEIDLNTIPNGYRIKLVSNNRYLTSTAASSSPYLYWNDYSGNNQQAWYPSYT